MKLSDFDFDLPERLIALRPAAPRDHARLLVVHPSADMPLIDSQVYELPSFLREGDVLVMNNTRVIPAALHGTRTRRSSPQAQELSISGNLLERIEGTLWRMLLKPRKRLKIGDRLVFRAQSSQRDHNHEGHALEGVVEALQEDGSVLVKFDCNEHDFMSRLDKVGSMPLPPYIDSRRQADAKDHEDYQTTYAKEAGAVAAPTAGLHFTPELFRALDEKGVERCEITLHVGAGTFLPVTTDNVDDHIMHAEWGQVDEAICRKLNAAKDNGNRIIAVGTTSLRLLESAADEEGILRPFCGETDIFIRPGYSFRFIDGLMTNFHLPKSTLFMLVSALCGCEMMKKAYYHAIEKEYRFFSYGDSSLLWRS
jgi:S-adenosylmethionine:tRNA ribosyltransferase-isomerase